MVRFTKEEKEEKKKIGEQILAEHIPSIKDNIEELAKKKMSKDQAESVQDKAKTILEKNFSGKMLKKMMKQLDKTMTDLQSKGKSKNGKEEKETRE